VSANFFHISVQPPHKEHVAGVRIGMIETICKDRFTDVFAITFGDDDSFPSGIILPESLQVIGFIGEIQLYLRGLLKLLIIVQSSGIHLSDCIPEAGKEPAFPQALMFKNSLALSSKQQF